MKGFNFKYVLFMVLALAACLAADAFTSGGETLAVLATAPLAVATTKFDVAKLKIPVEEFEQLKAKYGRLFVIDLVFDEEESYQFIVRRPTKSVMSAIADKHDDFNAANDLIVKNILVGGDKEALEDGLVYNGFMKLVSKVMEHGRGFFYKA